MAVLRVIAAPLGGLAAALVLFARSSALDEVAQPGQLGPGFWPRLVLVGLGTSCVAKILVDLRQRKPQRVAIGHAAAPAVSGAMLAWSIGAILLYVLVTPVLGFALTTVVFTAGFMWLGGARSVVALGTTAVLATVGLLYVFVKAVYLPLPKGAGALETVTIALYRALGIF